MPAFKDENKKTRFCKFYYVDFSGTKKQKKKRGFTTKKQATEWERDFLVKYQSEITIPFSVLIKHYQEDMKARLKPSTIYSKNVIIEKHILPYFKDTPINKITPKHVRSWQNEMINHEKNFSQTYLKTLQTQLVSIFNYAVRYYDLKENPCNKAGSMGSLKTEKEMTIWTIDQFKEFIATEEDSLYYTAFNTLFYTGLRVGELLALTWNDIDFNDNTLSVTKSFQQLHGQIYITSPKTPKSVRTIVIFPYLSQILLKYKNALYESKSSDRIFNTTKSSLLRELRRKAKEIELPPIRLHDLRHPYVKPTTKKFITFFEAFRAAI